MHHLNVFRRKFNVFIENLTELPNSMVFITAAKNFSCSVAHGLCCSHGIQSRENFSVFLGQYMRCALKRPLIFGYIQQSHYR
jgi:hypothetical protein